MTTKNKLGINEIFDKLNNNLKNSYAIYSNFCVSAILETKSSENYKYYFGNNVENRSYSLTICAERNVIFNFISNKEKDEEILNLYILATNKEMTFDKFVYPCGACLGVISEFFSDDTGIFCFSFDNVYQKFKIKELLPVNFKLNSKGE